MSIGVLGTCGCVCAESCGTFRVIGLVRDAGYYPICGVYFLGVYYPYTGSWPRGGSHPDADVKSTIGGSIRRQYWGSYNILKGGFGPGSETRYLRVDRSRRWTSRRVDESGLFTPPRDTVTESGGVDEYVLIDEDTGVDKYWECYTYCGHAWRRQTWTLNEDGTTSTTDESSVSTDLHTMDWSVAGQGAGSWSAEITLTTISASGSGDANVYIGGGDVWHQYSTIEDTWTFSQPYALPAWKEKAKSLLSEVPLSLTSSVDYHDISHGAQTWTPTPGFEKAFAVFWEWGAGVAKHKCKRALDSFSNPNVETIALDHCGGVEGWYLGRVVEAYPAGSKYMMARAVASLRDFCRSYWTEAETNFGMTVRFDLWDTEFADKIKSSGDGFPATGVVRKYPRICVKGQQLLVTPDQDGRMSVWIKGNPDMRVYTTPASASEFTWRVAWQLSQYSKPINLNTTPIQSDEDVLGSGE